jgi:hypothetical protein
VGKAAMFVSADVVKEALIFFVEKSVVIFNQSHHFDFRAGGENLWTEL